MEPPTKQARAKRRRSPPSLFTAFVARWCGSVEQICTRRHCQQKCQQQCRASLIELSLLVALSQPRIKLRRSQGSAPLPWSRRGPGRLTREPPGCRLWRLRLHPWAGRGRVPFRDDARQPQSPHWADQGLPPHGATPPPPARGREGVCGDGCRARADRRLCRLYKNLERSISSCDHSVRR